MSEAQKFVERPNVLIFREFYYKGTVSGVSVYFVSNMEVSTESPGVDEILLEKIDTRETVSLQKVETEEFLKSLYEMTDFPVYNETHPDFRTEFHVRSNHAGLHIMASFEDANWTITIKMGDSKVNMSKQDLSQLLQYLNDAIDQ